MKKIKIRPQEKKVTAKEFKPIDFLDKNRKKIINFSAILIAIILCLSPLWIWQENKKSNALVTIAQAKDLFYAGKYETSLSMYKEFIKEFPKHRLMPAALLGAGYCYEELGNKDEAKRMFLEVKNKFANSPWNEDALKGIRRLE